MWFGEAADANEILCVDEKGLGAGVLAVEYLSALVVLYSDMALHELPDTY